MSVRERERKCGVRGGMRIWAPLDNHMKNPPQVIRHNEMIGALLVRIKELLPILLDIICPPGYRIFLHHNSASLTRGFIVG